MVQIKFLLSVSIALLIGQHQVLASGILETLPPGKHNLYVEIGPWGTSGLCAYAYAVDQGKVGSDLATFEDCEEYRKTASDWAIFVTKPGEIEVRSPCSEGKLDILKKTGEGKFSENGGPTQIYQGVICANS